MKICIGVPANKPIKARTVQSLLDMVAVSPYEFLIIIATEGYTPSEKRNYTIVQSLNKNCDYTLFVDDDMVFPPETLTTLISRDKDVIGGLYYLKGLPLEPIIELEKGQKILEEPFMCKGVGAGLLLANNKIFMKMKKPWFDTKVDGLGQTVVGDSFYFCDKAREAGFEVWCDGSLKIGHIGEFIYKDEKIFDN